MHNKSLTWLFAPDAAGGALGRTRGAGYFTRSPNFRTYPGQGAGVLLPLSPSSQKARILVAGGGSETALTVDHTTAATSTAEIFEFDATRPASEQRGWRPTAPMNNRRFMSDGVLLPDGSVLLVGGSARGKADDNSEPVFEAELFDPLTETWKRMASQQVPRRYHSVALLLPDARVLSAGSTENFPHAPFPLDTRHPPMNPERRAEIFTPPYLFRGERPKIARTQTIIGYAKTLVIELARPRPRKRLAGSIRSVALVRPGAVTHTNDMDQRHLRLNVIARIRRNGYLRYVHVRTPPDSTWAPPGWYMLFVLSDDGVPSHTHFIRLRR